MTTFCIILAVYAAVLGAAFIMKEWLPGQKLTEKNVQRTLKKIGCTNIEIKDGMWLATYEQGQICVSLDNVPYAGFMVKWSISEDFKPDLVKKAIDACNKAGWFNGWLGEDNTLALTIIKPLFYRKELEECIQKLIPFVDDKGRKIFLEYYCEIERNEWKDANLNELIQNQE